MTPTCVPGVHLLLLVSTGLLVGGLQPPDVAGSEAPVESGHSHEGPATRPPEPGAESGRGFNARDTWLLFLRQSDKGVNGRRPSHAKARGLRLSLPGPPGPPGPRGPPGPVLPPEALLKDFQALLRGAAQRHESQEGPEPCPGGPTEDEQAGAGMLTVLAAALAPGPRAPRIQAAFLCRLRWDTLVERRSLQELAGYYLPAVQGAFRRGPGLNLTSGQYSAPVSGLYALAATLHAALAEPYRRTPPRPRDRLRLLICIQSRCQGHASLEAMLGTEGRGELLSLSVSGVLHLQTGQYVSVFLDNASGSPLTVRAGSLFSAVLLGV